MKQENDFSQRVWNIIEWLQASSLYFPKVTLVRYGLRVLYLESVLTNGVDHVIKILPNLPRC